MSEKKKDVNNQDTWGDLGQNPKPPAVPSKRERQSTASFPLERPSTKMVAIGGPPPVPTSKPVPRSRTTTLMGVTHAPPVPAPSRVSRSFKRPSDSTPPSQPLMDVSDLFPVTVAPAIEQPKPVVVLTRRQKLVAWLNRSRLTRWIARLLGG